MNRQELINIIKQRSNFLCVGLDPDPAKMPASLNDDVFEFNRRIIDATAPYCVAYKPNLAFYESRGLRGYEAFEKTVAYLNEKYPEHFIIADAKRGDIGNTSRMYAKSFFEEMNIDAVTVAPYMGEDSVVPFMAYEGHWTILLALTSNKGSHDFQFITTTDGSQLFQEVICKALTWGTQDNLMFVVGATQGKMFEEIRKIAPHNFLLVPGVGAQGGSLEEVVKYGMTPEIGLLVNSSRGIIHASQNDDFDTVAAAKASELAADMKRLMVEYGVL